ncbi:MAG: ATP-binding protein [Pseudomonadota bacterium]
MPSGPPWFLPFGFAVMLSATALALAKEYGDAFLHVEQQVDARTKDLGMALDRLRAMEKMKERFFANVSHDFKTPITIALGAVEELASEMRDLVGEKLKPVDRSLRRLLDMITTMLDTLKAESGTLKLDWKLVHPAELLSGWAEPFRLLCAQKGIEFQVDTYGFENLKIPMDPPKIERVIDNLLSNAIKFTDRRVVPADRKNHPTPIIKVSMRTDSARAYFEVSDSGIGIPPAERDKIFDRYYQSSRTSLKEHGGSGIGLSFVKEMAELHNGKVSVVESEFGGSKFVVALPLSQDVEIIAEASVDDPSRKSVLHGTLDVAYPRERPEKTQEGRPTLLVAEDNPEVAQIVFTALADEYNVHFAPDGKKALERLKSEPFDALVTDIMMPQMRGDELVEAARKSPKLQALPIIMLSSHDDEETITRLLRGGANDYVTKPFRREILLARVRAQIEAHKTAEWIANNEKVIELGYLAGGMAHQIRNGINQLVNNVKFQRAMAADLIARMQKASPEEAAKLQEKLDATSAVIDRAMERIRTLVDAVRTYSSGSKQRTEINLADSIELAKSLHADKIKLKGVAVELFGTEGVKLLGYASFHEILVNLIGNAIEACPSDGAGKIIVKGRDLGAEFELSIRDNGAGIKPETLPNLCRPFFTTKSPTEGTGLGLYIVRSIVEGQHGGTLTVASDGVGKGATFTIRIPKEAPEPITNPEVSLHGIDVS